MENARFIFGPVPSRRLGRSLGVSPIPEKTCNYTCTYCQLGRTLHMTGGRHMFYPVEDIIAELKKRLAEDTEFDVISVVGEGEPTLYKGLGDLLDGIKKLTKAPVAVITNGALLSDPQVRSELSKADIVLPSMDAFDEDSWKKIDRPHGKLDFNAVMKGLQTFSHEYTGQLWLEIMLIDGINTSDTALNALKKLAGTVRHDRLYINTPVRPPAESFVSAPADAVVEKAVKLTGGIAINHLTSGSFSSDIKDTYEAVISIIKRHPMNRFEIESFVASRKVDSFPPCADLFSRLEKDAHVQTIDYKGIKTYRYKNR